MANYIGVKCPVCNKKFIPADDIVVCPVCGAPHHRACYAQKSECAFASEHIGGVEWRAPPPEAPSDGAGAAVCVHCGAQSSAGAIFCQRCGERISAVRPREYSAPREDSRDPSAWGFPGVSVSFDPVAMIYGGLSPDEKISGESVRDLAVYIGTNTAYYLPRFKSISESPQKISFNLTALVFNFFYFFYRKMYSIGAFLLILFVVGAIPSFLQAREMMPQIMYSLGLGPNVIVNEALISRYQTMVNIAGGVNFAAGIMASFAANRLYFAKAVSDVKNIREYDSMSHDEITYNKALSLKGGVDRASVGIVAGILMAVYFLAVSIISYNQI